MAFPPDAGTVRAILLDIEGTTTPVAFVYQTLFPFARRRVEEFLRLHGAEAKVEADIRALQAQHQADTAAHAGPPPWANDSPEAERNSAVNYARWLMDDDSKCSALKSLQGKIWQEGYAKGDLRGEVYPDVPPAMNRWSRQGKRVCIFSSGSVLAQKLIFSSTPAGDLTRLIDSYFDTAIGPKREPASYSRIADSLALPAREIFFISDVVAELDAARQAGMQTALCVRDTPPKESAEKHPVIHSLNGLFP